jgi:hypothetical protein
MTADCDGLPSHARIYLFVVIQLTRRGRRLGRVVMLADQSSKPRVR